MLRISITDRCNFRCVYCMPEGGVKWLDRDRLLRFEEIVEIVRASVQHHGIDRFKLTGGEPTVRSGLVDLVRMLRNIKGVRELSMTTNGMRLLDLAAPLREAGLDRITVSIDSLRPDRFKRITRTGDLQTVLRGIERASDVGFKSIKINCVAMRGVNDDELVDFAKLTLDKPWTVRFIEYMPLGDAALLHPLPGGRMADNETGPAGGCGAQDRGEAALISEADMRNIIESQLGSLDLIDRDQEAGVGPARVYQLMRLSAKGARAAGRIGFISAMSAPFCATCNRLRLTSDGELRSCLFEGGQVQLLPILRREGTSPAERARELAAAMEKCVAMKPTVHTRHGLDQMSRIGG